MLTAVTILIILTTFWLIIRHASDGNNQLLNSPTPAPLSGSIPQTIKFDANTDLKKELDSVNPNLEENDFSDTSK